MRPVKAGVTHNSVTVIEQGVQPGEQVVIDGQIRVIPGGKVMLKQPAEKQGPGKVQKSPVTAADAGSTRQ
jgi:multidrug efflux system membrane fusion protein